MVCRDLKASVSTNRKKGGTSTPIRSNFFPYIWEQLHKTQGKALCLCIRHGPIRNFRVFDPEVRYQGESSLLSRDGNTLLLWHHAILYDTEGRQQRKIEGSKSEVPVSMAVNITKRHLAAVWKRDCSIFDIVGGKQQTSFHAGSTTSRGHRGK